MTKHIYIRGDMGDPLSLKIFDADTEVQLEVRGLSLFMLASNQPLADITILNTTTSITVAVVPAPPVKHAGKVLKEVELTTDRFNCRTIHRATMTEWEVQPDGTVRPNPATRAFKQHAVDDSLLVQYGGNAKDLLEDSARRVLEDMANYLISPLMSTGAPLATNPFKQPPPLTASGSGPLPGIDPTITPVAKCDECGGSGEWISPVTNKKSDCSQGCKRP